MFALVLSTERARAATVVQTAARELVQFSRREGVLDAFTRELGEKRCASWVAIYSLVQRIATFASAIPTSATETIHVVAGARHVSINAGSAGNRAVAGTNKTLVPYPELLEGLHRSAGVSATGATLSRGK